MPISASSFDHVGPLSREWRELTREMASDVDTLLALYTEIQKKVMEAKGGKSAGFIPGASYSFVITGATSINTSPNQWRYDATIGEIDPDTGATTAVSGGLEAVLYNHAEDNSAYQHGQDMAPAGVTLTTGPVEGPVIARATGLLYDTNVPVFVFDMLNPTDPTCP